VKEFRKLKVGATYLIDGVGDYRLVSVIKEGCSYTLLFYSEDNPKNFWRIQKTNGKKVEGLIPIDALIANRLILGGRIYEK